MLSEQLTEEESLDQHLSFSHERNTLQSYGLTCASESNLVSAYGWEEPE